MSEQIYGSHLMLRVSEIERKGTLENERIVAECLEEIVYKIGMRILSGPFTAQETTTHNKCGCSAVILLYESHAAIHTYSTLGEAFVDIFSCRLFHPSRVIQTLNQFFGPFVITEQKLLHRGVHWGSNIVEEMDNWVSAR